MKKMIFVLLLGLTTTAFAQDRSSGCGLGWQVTRSMTTTGSYVRALTNATFSNTLAMTSGTSGCAKHDLVLNQKEKIHYVESNLIPLKREVAMGEGERLKALAAVWGCAHSENFAPVLKQNYRQLFYKKEAAQVVQEIDQLVTSAPVCSLNS